MQYQFSSDTFHYSLVGEVFYGLFRRKTTVPGIPFDKQLTIEVCFWYRSRIPGFFFVVFDQGLAQRTSRWQWGFTVVAHLVWQRIVLIRSNSTTGFQNPTSIKPKRKRKKRMNAHLSFWPHHGVNMLHILFKQSSFD